MYGVSLACEWLTDGSGNGSSGPVTDELFRQAKPHIHGIHAWLRRCDTHERVTGIVDLTHSRWHSEPAGMMNDNPITSESIADFEAEGVEVIVNWYGTELPPVSYRFNRVQDGDTITLDYVHDPRPDGHR